MTQQRLDRVLDPAFADNLEQIETDQLRHRRAEAEAEEEAVSYARRLVQGRVDILRSEVRRREEDGDAEASSLLSSLTNVLGEGSGGARSVMGARATRLRVPDGAHRYEEQLEARLQGAGFDRLESVPLETLEDLVSQLAAFEDELSAIRRTLFARIDALRDELAARYKDGRAAVADLLADPS